VTSSLSSSKRREDESDGQRIEADKRMYDRLSAYPFAEGIRWLFLANP
jgi:hypothetical protein